MAIDIKPSHKGLLTQKVGKKGLTEKNLAKEKVAAKKSGNVTLEREIVFAQNAKHFNHKGNGGKGNPHGFKGTS